VYILGRERIVYEAYVRPVSGRRFRPVLDLGAESARSVQPWGELFTRPMWGSPAVGGSSARSLIDLDRGVHVLCSRGGVLRRCTLIAVHYDPGSVHVGVVRRRSKGTGCPFVLCCTGWLHKTHRSLDCETRGAMSGWIWVGGYGGVGGGAGWGGGWFYTLFYETWLRLVGGRRFRPVFDLGVGCARGVPVLEEIGYGA
jgi:hypothetical protein